MNHDKPAIVLLSGGLDSATVLAIARSEGFTPIALSIRYGQRHAIELEAAVQVAAATGVAEHVFVDIDLRAFGGSALTADIPVPKDRGPAESSGIPITYVPARNTVLLSLALGYAEVVGAADIFIGVNALDYSGYPDCREEYIAAFARLADLAIAGSASPTSGCTTGEISSFRARASTAGSDSSSGPDSGDSEDITKVELESSTRSPAALSTVIAKVTKLVDPRARTLSTVPRTERASSISQGRCHRNV